MHQRSVFGDRAYWRVRQRLAVVAGTLLAGLLACGALLAALGGPVPSALAAAPVTYPGSAPCNTSLQACIDGSPSGTTIVVQADNYYTDTLNLSKAVSLTGVSSATVILHGLEDQRVLRVTGAAVDSSVIISGLTFVAGHALGVGCPTGCGGAIIITGTAQPLLINLTISNSIADWFGGGLYAEPGSPLVMSGVAVLSNTAVHAGGGVYATDSVTISGSLFQSNQCSLIFCQGGGLFAINSLSLTGAQFLSNTSDGSGAGSYATADAQVTGSVFQNNQCSGSLIACGGGGLFASSTLAVTNTLFLGNRAGQGAGLYHNGGDGRLVNDLFAANHSGRQGDALYLASTGSVAVLHTTIASPTLGSGSAIYVNTGTVVLTNTLIASEAVGLENAGGSVQEDYTLFSSVTTHLSGTVASGAHSLTGPAGFVNPIAGDYHLAPGSAAIDAGVDAGITFDVDGDPRPLGNGFDIGFDEVDIRQLFLPLVRR